MRPGRAAIEAGPDGIDLGGAVLESQMLAGLMTRAAMDICGTMAFQSGIDMYAALFAATPAFVWLATPGNGRADRIAAGRDWLRLALSVTGAGPSLHPVSQALQEFPGMAGHSRPAHELLARHGCLRTCRRCGDYSGRGPRRLTRLPQSGRAARVPAPQGSPDDHRAVDP